MPQLKAECTKLETNDEISQHTWHTCRRSPRLKHLASQITPELAQYLPLAVQDKVHNEDNSYSMQQAFSGLGYKIFSKWLNVHAFISCLILTRISTAMSR